MVNRRSVVPTRERKARSKHVSNPNLLRDAIESERGKLVKAESVLGCLTISMEYESDLRTGPHYPDVVQVACDLIRQSIDGLDSLNLERFMHHDKVKEESDSWVSARSCLPSTPGAWSDCDLLYSERCRVVH